MNHMKYVDNNNDNNNKLILLACNVLQCFLYLIIDRICFNQFATFQSIPLNNLVRINKTNMLLILLLMNCYHCYNVVLGTQQEVW